MLIHTSHFRLVRMELEYLDAIVNNKRKLESILKIKIPDTWPKCLENYKKLNKAKDKNRSRIIQAWWFFLVIDAKSRHLIGASGFRDFPDKDGQVEIGYELTSLPSTRQVENEILGALIRYAFTRPEVNKVVFRTGSSLGYLRKVLTSLNLKPRTGLGSEIKWCIHRDQL